MAAGERRLRRADRLRSPRDYARVAREGERRASAHFVVLLGRERSGERGRTGPRLGLTVSRRVGKAVVRSRVKRRIRESFRARRALLPPEADVVVIARPGAGRLSASAAQAELAGLLAQGARW